MTLVGQRRELLRFAGALGRTLRQAEMLRRELDWERQLRAEAIDALRCYRAAVEKLLVLYRERAALSTPPVRRVTLH